MATFDLSAARGLVAAGLWRRWALVASLARLPSVMAPFALLLAGREATGDFARGAWLVSAYALGAAAAAPSRGRALDRNGSSAALGGALRGTALALAALGVAMAARAPFPLLLVLALAVGVVPAGVSGGVRALLGSLAQGPALESAFALEAALFELLWVVGPLVVGAAAALGAPLVAIGVMALSALAASALVGWLPARAPLTAGRAPPGGLWRVPGAAPTLGTALCFGVSWGAIEVGLPVRLEQLGAPAAFWGVLSALLAGASAGGAVLYAAWPRAGGEAGARRRSIALATAWAGLLSLAARASSPAALALSFAGAGFVLAPLCAQLTSALQRALPEARRAEGFAAYGACWSAGMAAGAALGGLLLASHGPGPLLALAPLLPLAAFGARRAPRPSLSPHAAGEVKTG